VRAIPSGGNARTRRLLRARQPRGFRVGHEDSSDMFADRPPHSYASSRLSATPGRKGEEGRRCVDRGSSSQSATTARIVPNDGTGNRALGETWGSRRTLSCSPPPTSHGAERGSRRPAQPAPSAPGSSGSSRDPLAQAGRSLTLEAPCERPVGHISTQESKGAEPLKGHAPR
jgi:hypothetical protein